MSYAIALAILSNRTNLSLVRYRHASQHLWNEVPVLAQVCVQPQLQSEFQAKPGIKWDDVSKWTSKNKQTKQAYITYVNKWKLKFFPIET